MTLPRQFLSNTTYFITRRTTQREFWLKPTKQTTQIFLYCMAFAAEKTGVQIHAACVMSNHWHVIATDPHMKIAEFYGWVHKYVAKAVNCLYGRWENLWSSDKPSVIALESAEDVLDKTAYILCNPVAGRLIARASHWKGVWLYQKGHSRTVKRPAVYFTTDGTMPEKVELRIHQTPSHQNMSKGTYEKMIADEITHREQQIIEEMKSDGKSVMGMDAVLKQSPKDSPRSVESRRDMNPKFAARDKELRISAIKRYKQFLLYYWEALKEWKQQNREVVFPAGTYAMRIHSCVNVSPG